MRLVRLVTEIRLTYEYLLRVSKPRSARELERAIKRGYLRINPSLLDEVLKGLVDLNLVETGINWHYRQTYKGVRTYGSQSNRKLRK